jgi:lysyl-tRNA synthetase class 2
MQLTEEMVQYIAERVLGTLQVEFQGAKLDLSGPWRRVTLREAILAETGVDVLGNADLGSLRAACREKGVGPLDAPTWGRLVDDLFSEHVEPKLLQPTFVTDYPVELSPLAKRSAGDPRLVERFEPFLAGMEIGNAFSELNDPDDQRERLLLSRQAREEGDEEAHPLDEDYLRALEVGLPPTGGLGVGVDRLAMILADAPSLREVIAFPHVRPREGGEGAQAGGDADADEDEGE